MSAIRVIERFGGPRAVADAMRAAGTPVDVATVYRWTYPHHRKGSGNRIPSRRIEQLRHAARRQGLLLTAEDFF